MRGRIRIPERSGIALMIVAGIAVCMCLQFGNEKHEKSDTSPPGATINQRRETPAIRDPRELPSEPVPVSEP